MFHDKLRTLSLPGFIIILTGGFAVLLGLSVLIGWYSHNITLIQVRPNFVPMQYNTALGFLFSGMGIVAIAVSRLRLAQACGAVVAVIGLLTLIEYIFGLDLKIDQLFMQHYVTVKTSNPGRMAPNTALTFSFSGVFMLLQAKVFPGVPRSVVSGIFGSVIIALGMVPLFGYLTGVETAYGWGYLTRVAVHTAVGFIMLGLGIIAYTWHISRREDHGTPRWIPVVAGISVLTISVLLWQALTANDTKKLRDNTRLEAGGYAAIVETAMNDRISMLVQLARRWQQEGRPSRERWQHDAEVISRQDGYQAIEWVDPSYHVRWIVPETGNEMVRNMPSAFEEKRHLALDKARERRDVSVTSAIKLKQGGTGFLVYVPIFVKNQFEGFILGVFQINGLLEAVLPKKVTAGYTLELYSDQNEIYRRGNDPLLVNIRGEANINFYDTQWHIKISPGYALLNRQESHLSEVILGLGAMMALLLALSIHFLQSTRVHAAGVLAANRRLREEVVVRKRAELNLEKQASSLVRSNTELEQFAYVASHDLQEPLRMVTSYMQLLEKRYKDKLDVDASEFIGYAVDGAARMKLLITDLLTYSRVGTQVEAFAQVDCETVLNGALANLSGLIEIEQAKVTHDPLPKVPGAATQLLQLFQNLVGNAIKFRGSEAPRVHISAQTEAKSWTFQVRDNGIGIAPEFHNRIFAVFQRLHDRVTYEGTGIGLALCKKIIERHGGDIWLESELGHGTVFYFTLPNKQVITDG